MLYELRIEHILALMTFVALKSVRSSSRLAKTNKKLSEIATTDESVIFSPLQLQEISIPVPSQKQPIIRYD